MADTALTDAKGRLAYQMAAAGGNDDLIIVPLSAVDIDATFEDGYADFFLDTVLGAAGNTEETGGGWSRKVHTNAVITDQADDTANLWRVILDADDTWGSVTGGFDVVALLICIDGASDAVREVIGKWDFAVTTDGNDVTANYDQVNGIWTAA
jgi:hypothetical protein